MHLHAVKKTEYHQGNIFFPKSELMHVLWVIIFFSFPLFICCYFEILNDSAFQTCLWWCLTGGKFLQPASRTCKAGWPASECSQQITIFTQHFTLTKFFSCSVVLFPGVTYVCRQTCAGEMLRPWPRDANHQLGNGVCVSEKQVQFS